MDSQLVTLCYCLCISEVDVIFQIFSFLRFCSGNGRIEIPEEFGMFSTIAFTRILVRLVAPFSMQKLKEIENIQTYGQLNVSVKKHAAELMALKQPISIDSSRPSVSQNDKNCIQFYCYNFFQICMAQDDKIRKECWNILDRIYTVLLWLM